MRTVAVKIIEGLLFYSSKIPIFRVIRGPVKVVLHPHKYCSKWAYTWSIENWSYLESVLFNLTECIFVFRTVIDFLFSKLWNFPLFFGGKIQSLLYKKSMTVLKTKTYSVRLNKTDSRGIHSNSTQTQEGGGHLQW